MPNYQNRSSVEMNLDRYAASLDAYAALEDAMKNPIAREMLKQVNEDLKHF